MLPWQCFCQGALGQNFQLFCKKLPFSPSKSIHIGFLVQIRNQLLKIDPCAKVQPDWTKDKEAQIVLSMFSCVAPQNADFMNRRMQVYLFLQKWYFRTYLLQATFIATFFVYRQNKAKEMDNVCMHWIELLIFTEILIKIRRFVVDMVTKHNLCDQL